MNEKKRQSKAKKYVPFFVSMFTTKYFDIERI
jgi:hypothetical protein